MAFKALYLKEKEKSMTQKRWLFVLLVVSSLYGADFDWMSSLNTRYRSDSVLLHSNLNERFNVGDAIVSSVIKSVANPSDAYMVLKLAEMSGVAPKNVLQKYDTSKDKGWGAMAQSLEIKPGSAEFKALKAGHDIERSQKDSNRKNEEKGRGKEGKKDKDDNDNAKGKGKKAD